MAYARHDSVRQASALSDLLDRSAWRVLFWGQGSGSSFEPVGGGGFGGDYARAVQNGFDPAMPGWMWESMQMWNAAAQAALAKGRQAKAEPKPVVETSYEITMPDGTTVTDNPWMQLAKDVSTRTEPLTRPQIYGEFVVFSAVGGVGARIGWGVLTQNITFQGPDPRGKILGVNVGPYQVARLDYDPIPGSGGQPVLHLHLEPFRMKTHIPIIPPGRPR